MSDDNKLSAQYSPIQCQIYDTIEIACMRQYRLDVTLHSGEIISGKAITTRIRDKQEFIVLHLETNEAKPENINANLEQEIRLDLINKITATTENAEFGTVIIN